MSQEGFACPSCGAQVVDADKEGDWMCAECGETHFAAAAPPPPPPPPPDDAEVGAAAPPVVPLLPAATYEGRPAGMRRHFGVCILLGLVSLGIYFLYWQLRVFGEVDRQEGRPRLAWLWWTGFAAGAVAVFLTLSAARAGESAPVAALLLVLVAQGSYLAYIGAEGWNLRAASERRGIPGPAIPVVVGFLAISAAVHLLSVVLDWPSPIELVTLPLELFAYAILQDGLNRYWDAVGQSRGTAAAAAPAPEGTG